MDKERKIARVQPRLAPGYLPPPMALEREVTRDPENHVRQVRFTEPIQPIFIDPPGTSRMKAKPKTVEPQKYDGSFPAEDWFDMLLMAADTNGWSVDDQLVKRAATYLTGKAYKAYKYLIYNAKMDITDENETPDPNTTFRFQNGIAKNIEWGTFVDHMKNMFPRHLSLVNTKVHLDERRQRKGESFSSYAVDKLALCLEHDERMSQKTKVLNLISGALEFVKDKLEDKEDEILGAEEPVELCIQLGNKYTRNLGEKKDILEETRFLHDGLLASVAKMEETTKRMLDTSQKVIPPPSPKMKVINGYRQQQLRLNNRPRNLNLQERGRIVNNKWVPNANYICYFCGRPGHLQRNCYARQRALGGQFPSASAPPAPLEEQEQTQWQTERRPDVNETFKSTARPFQSNQGN